MASKAKDKPQASLFFLSLGKGFKFFGVHAKYIFIPAILITLAIGICLLLSALGISISLTQFADKGNEVLEGAGESKRLTYPDPWTSFIDAFRGLGLDSILGGEVSSLGIQDQSILNQLGNQKPGSALTGTLYFGAGAGVVTIAYLLSGILIGMMIKKKLGISRGWKYTLLSLLLKFVIFAGLLIGIGYLFSFIPLVGGILGLVLIPFIESLFALHRAYLVQRGLKKTKGMFTSVSFKDVLFYLSLTWILYLSFMGLVLLLLLIVGENRSLIAFLALPLFSYISAFLDVYAEVFVLDKFKRLKTA